MSDQTDSIFEKDNTSTQTPEGSLKELPTPGVNSELTDLLNSIKNDKGEPKYKDVTEAFKGLQHSQQYIPELKNQLTEKESALAKALEEIERLKAVEESVRELTQAKEKDQKVTDTTDKTLTPEQIQDIVAKALSQKEAEKSQFENISLVRSTLEAAYGKEAETKFYQRAAELGLSQQEINQLAATKPQAVLSMIGVTGKQEKAPTVITSGVNSVHLQNKPETAIGRNTKSLALGATSEDVKEASDRANRMVEELHATGHTIHDLTNPKVYAKLFGK